jgi:hypothetical protein
MGRPDGRSALEVQDLPQAAAVPRQIRRPMEQPVKAAGTQGQGG